MTYADDKFWDDYAEFIEESSERHEAAVMALCNAARTSLHGLNVLDLGCGKHREARRLLNPRSYLGVDKDPPEGEGTFKANYIDEWGIIADTAKNPWKSPAPLHPDLVAALFSVEVTGPPAFNRTFYEAIFTDLPTVRHIIAAGFYYTDKANEATVQEAGGLTSFQTIDRQGELDTKYREVRLYLHAPSKLFGPNVVEVWKLLTR